MSNNENGRNRGASRRDFIKTTTAIGIGLAAPWVISTRKAAGAVATVIDPRFTQPVIDPLAIPQFVDALPVPGGTAWPVLTGTSINLNVQQVSTQILPATLGLSTPGWGYRGSTAYTSTYLGPTIVGQSRTPTTVVYDYSPLGGFTTHILKQGGTTDLTGGPSVVDKHLHGTDNSEPEVRFIAHKHGSVGVGPGSDGYAEFWITPGGTQNTPTPTPPGPSVVPTKVGTAGNQHLYPNAQGACLAWYHDHALGITRLNVHAGMAAAFLITDTNESDRITRGELPALGGAFDIPLVIQDRMFYPNGWIAYPDQPFLLLTGCTPWPGGVSTLPEYFGDVIVVNGKAWPKLDVEPGMYRFRFLNGCDSRVLDISTSPPVDFTIIGTEGGFLPNPVTRKNLVIGPAERFDVLVDLTKFAGKTLTMINKGAKKPFPKGTPPDPRTDGLVMKLNVIKPLTQTPLTPLTLPLVDPASVPGAPPLPTVSRQVLLYEGRDQYGRIQPLLGAVVQSAPGTYSATPKLWDDPVTETPTAGRREIWEIFNTTVDTHPIHIHEIALSVLNRQGISFDKKLAAPPVCGPIPPTFAFPITLRGVTKPAEAYETGFKDTVLASPGEVTRIVADFAKAQPGRFVWHCHILEHEDNEMMRPYDVL